MKNYYEFLGIVPGNLAENEIMPVMKKITDFFAAQGAEIAYQEILGRRRLAYPIKQLRHGYYLLLEFNFDGDGLSEIESKLKIDDQLLRFLIIKSYPKSREQREKEKMRQQTQGEKRDRSTTEKTIIDKSKISLDDLDKKLDEILEEKI